MRLRQQGVTLIELVLVMLILSIVGFGFVKLIVFSSTLYQHQVATRTALAQAGFIGARLRDSLKSVLPDSVEIRRTLNQQICLDLIPLNHLGLYTRWQGEAQKVAIFMPDMPTTPPIQLPQAIFFEGALPRPTFPYRHFSWVQQATLSNLTLKKAASIKSSELLPPIGRFYMATDVQSFCLIPTTEPNETRPFADLYECREPALKRKNNWLRRVKSISNHCHLLARHIVAMPSSSTTDKMQSVFESTQLPFTVKKALDSNLKTVIFNFGLYMSSPVGDHLTQFDQHIQVGYER